MKINPSIALAVASAAMIAVSNGAVPISTISFAPAGAVSPNNGLVTTATQFTVVDLYTNPIGATGFFVGGTPVASQSLGTLFFDLTAPGPYFTITDAEFGTFVATTLVSSGGGAGFRNLVFSGSFAPGTQGGPALVNNPVYGEFFMTFTNNPSGDPNGVKTMSGSLAIQDINPIPEPGSALATAGLLAGGMFLRRRKQQA